MSYILEALKKAQAERQLGAAPTIHALPLHADTPRARRSPIWIGFGVGALVMACAALVLWRALSAAAPAPAPAASPAMAPAITPPMAQAMAPPITPPTAHAMAPPMAPPMAPAGAPAPAQAGGQSVGTAIAQPGAAPAAPSLAQPSAQALRVAAQGAAPVPSPMPPAPAPAAPAAAAAEDNAPLLRELPEAIQREVPAVVFGGYIYSRNPADRLLLVDKVLRHEGEEVAPGLLLEKLLPKAAIMNYRGHRYRMPY